MFQSMVESGGYEVALKRISFSLCGGIKCFHAILVDPDEK